MDSDDKLLMIEGWTKHVRSQTTPKAGRVGSDPATSSVESRTVNRSRPFWKLLHIIGMVLFVVQGIAGTVGAQSAAESKLAPVRNEDAPHRIADRYIVVFRPDVSREAVLIAQEKVKGLGGEILFTYTSALNGFSVRLPKEALRALRALPDIEYIEVDQMGTVETSQPPNPPTAPPTGIDRIDRRALPLNGNYTYSETGANVHVYIFDTGIRDTNTEFGGRASLGFDAIMDGTATNDCHGHGTNVAGIVGGSTYGIAKNVTLHSVRVADCTGFAPVSAMIMGVDWVTLNAIQPAVANVSLRWVGVLPTLNTAIVNSIGSGVTYVIAAGNDFGGNACFISPALVPEAITVGAVDPANDTRLPLSNIGPCVDLFAPGFNIVSAGFANDTATSSFDGTSQATAHVAGVAARYLETHPGANPATVWAAIHNADNVSTTVINGLPWPGIVDAGAGSPNELLHWGSLMDGLNDGDPHITTVDGVHYDFQSAGEFVALRDGNGTQIQTRQTPISTKFPVANAYTGLSTCVSVNTAVAASVNKHRVTFQPVLNGVANPDGLELRVDGKPVKLPANGLNLGPSGRVVRSVGGGVEIDFPDKTVLIVTPGWWASQSLWYLNVDVFHTTAVEGIMGTAAPGSWLPGLPDGSSLGPKPAALSQRYIDLYEKFADLWRVTDKTSLFDYAKGTSTATFTLSTWPQEKPPCVVPGSPMAKPVARRIARRHCRSIVNKNMNANCVFDVAVTGEPSFARTYQLSQKIHAGFTTITVSADKDRTKIGETVKFTATVARGVANGKNVLTGVVQFILDGEVIGKPVKLDKAGSAVLKLSKLMSGDHHVTARYFPPKGSVFLTSSSLDIIHIVNEAIE